MSICQAVGRFPGAAPTVEEGVPAAAEARWGAEGRDIRAKILDHCGQLAQECSEPLASEGQLGRLGAGRWLPCLFWQADLAFGASG